MTSRSDRDRAAGFTLIEMVMVVAILALMAVLVTVQGTPVSPAVHARAAAQAISGALRSARGEAVSRNRVVTFTLDLAKGSYRWGETPPENLTSDIRLALLTSQDQLVSSAVGRIRFHPDGSSSGGRVSVAGGDQIWWIGIDWLSGRVSLVEKPH
jgi:general secretion pathway protein H